jgi:hypothetical protein
MKRGWIVQIDEAKVATQQHSDAHAAMPANMPITEAQQHMAHQPHGSHVGHGGMSHDMSDPAMAKAMA